MTRREIFKWLTVFATCTRALATAPQKGVGIGILVRIQQRHSDLCLLHGGVQISRRRIPIGRGHFVNDVACCLGIDRKCASELVRKYGLPAAEEEPTLRQQGGVIRNPDGSVVSVARDQYTRIVEARAVEFAGLVRDGVTAMRPGSPAKTPLLLTGEWITGLDRLIERGALWDARRGVESPDCAERPVNG